MQNFVFIMNLSVKDEAVEDLKKAIDHNICALVDIDGWPEVTGIWDAQLVKLEDIEIHKLNYVDLRRANNGKQC